MKRVVPFVLFLVFLLFITESCSLFSSHEPELAGEEEHHVIQAVLDSLMSFADSVNVYDQTTIMINTNSIRTAMNRDLIVRDVSLLSNYNNANNMISYFDKDLFADNVILREIDTSAFYTGYWRFSCPGISINGKWAVVEFSSISAPLSGGGSAAMLKKEEDEWKIIWIKMLWIS